MAVDDYVLVKTGTDVLVSVRRALGATDLGHLRDAMSVNRGTLEAAILTRRRAGLCHSNADSADLMT